jgi:hypothetical protein
MGFPMGNERVKQSSHQVKTSKVYLTILLASIGLVLNIKGLILQF